MARPSSVVVRAEEYQIQSKNFKEYLLLLGHSKQGAGIKYNYLKEFLQFLETSGILEIQNIKTEDIKNYYQHISERSNKNGAGKLSEKTIVHQQRSLQLFFAMLQAKGQIRNNPVSALKSVQAKQSKERDIVSAEEIKMLYSVSEKGEERAILSLAYGCGLRAGEMAALNVEDIKTREALLIVQKGKGNKKRIVPMSKRVAEDLKYYFYNERQTVTNKERAFMVNSKGRRMRQYTFNKILKAIIERTENKTIKEKQITLHHLRHSIATHLLQQGVSLEQVRDFLGHSQLETTEVYTRVSEEQLKVRPWKNT